MSTLSASIQTADDQPINKFWIDRKTQEIIAWTLAAIVGVLCVWSYVISHLKKRNRRKKRRKRSKRGSKVNYTKVAQSSADNSNITTDDEKVKTPSPDPSQEFEQLEKLINAISDSIAIDNITGSGSASDIEQGPKLNSIFEEPEDQGKDEQESHTNVNP